jgi:hypothetical protein
LEVEQFLESDPLIGFIGEAVWGNEVLEQLRRQPWDLV